MERVYDIPGPRSQEITSGALDHIGKCVYAGLYGIALQSGKGVKVVDVDDNEYVDLLAGASAVTVGYGDVVIAEIMKEQALEMQHSCFPYSVNRYAMEYAEKITETFPGRTPNERIKTVFGLSGSDSNDAVIKMARKFTGKTGVISFRGAWHGLSGLSNGANGFPAVRAGLKFSRDFIHVPFPHTSQTAEKAIDRIKEELEKGDIAVVMVEIIQGDGGNLMPFPGALEKIRELCSEYETLFAVDEVQSGAGRSGKIWEIEHLGIKPDILSAAKGITSGYFPLSITMANERIVNSLGKVQHLFTQSANPIGCRVALEVLKRIQAPGFLNHVHDMGSLYQRELGKLVDELEFVRDIRGYGLHLGLEIQNGQQTFGGILGWLCVERGIYPGYFGMNNEVLRIHPPLIITEDDVRMSIEVISACARMIQDGGGRVDEESWRNYRKYAVGIGTDK